MASSTCPFCHVSVPSSELEWHANAHFEDDHDRWRQQQLASDYELAQQIAFSSNSLPQSDSALGEQAISGLQLGSTSGNSWHGSATEWKMEEKISCLIELQMRSRFHKIEGGLMTLLRNCLESEGGNSKCILSGYVDHFQSIELEDVGWGCGWRNIQILSSHLLMQRPEARQVMFGGSGFVPDIPSLQRWLEIAWERGFDVTGADQFNHAVYGSKKWIGTTECATLLRSFGLRARIVDFGPKESELLYLSVPGSSLRAQLMRNHNVNKRKAPHFCGPMDRYLSRDAPQASCGQDGTSNSSPSKPNDTMNDGNNDNMTKDNTYKSQGQQVLMDFVWNYFSNKGSIQFGHRHVIVTEKTPLYFQHDGHSRTIVGIQVKHQQAGNLQYNLLILDPAHKTADLERSLREKDKWQKLIKRGIHTLRKPQYQLCYVDPGLASAEEVEELKTIDSVFHEF